MNSAETLVTKNVSPTSATAAATVTISGQILKRDEERRMVFGWAYIAKRADGTAVVDHSGDRVDNTESLEFSAYEYVLKSREGDVMHTRKQTSVLVESMVFTPEKCEALGLAKDALPVGWWVGFKILDDEAWEGVKTGKYAMFSIEGKGTYAEAA